MVHHLRALRRQPDHNSPPGGPVAYQVHQAPTQLLPAIEAAIHQLEMVPREPHLREGRLSLD